MFRRPENQSSWKISKRKFFSFLSVRSWSSIAQLFFLGVFCGLLLFARDRTFEKPVRVTTQIAATTTAAPVPETPAAPTLGHVAVDTKARKVEPVTNTAQTTVKSRPFLVNGVPHPFPAAAHAWAEVAANVSGIQEPSINSSQPPLALFVLVKSAPTYTERRRLCRDHWQWRSASKKTHIGGLLEQQFLIGRSGKEDVDASVLKEKEKFGDILIYPGNDTYRRLPWKALWAMRYVVEHYQFDMLLLMDDDSFVNYPMVSPSCCTCVFKYNC